MAHITAHLVNAADGTHASGVTVTLYLLKADGTRSEHSRAVADHEGRFRIEVDRSGCPADDRYELTIAIASYFEAQGFRRQGLQVVDEVVIRLAMPDPDARYHFPITLAPNFSSVWWSS